MFVWCQNNPERNKLTANHGEAVMAPDRNIAVFPGGKGSFKNSYSFYLQGSYGINKDCHKNISTEKHLAQLILIFHFLHVKEWQSAQQQRYTSCWEKKVKMFKKCQNKGFLMLVGGPA